MIFSDLYFAKHCECSEEKEFCVRQDSRVGMHIVMLGLSECNWMFSYAAAATATTAATTTTKYSYYDELSSVCSCSLCPSLLFSLSLFVSKQGFWCDLN